MNSVKWCCEAFRRRHSRGGARGAAVLQTLSEEESRFYMQFRALEPGVGALPFPVESPVSLVEQVPITYCPWCGKNLEKVYGPQLAKMPVLATPI